MHNNNQNNSKQLNISIPVAIIVAGLLIALGIFGSNYFSKTKTNESASISNVAGEAANNNSVASNEGTNSSPTVQIDVSENDHIRGNFNAPITIVEWSDFQCPYCARFHETMKQLMANYPDKVRWVYKHFPLDSIHPYTRKAAEASECAAEQGKFWEYADKLFENQSNINQDYFFKAAEEINLNVSQFNECLNSGKYKSKVDADYQQGVKNGVNGTPGNFINGQSVPGAVPYEQIKSIIDSLL